MAEISDIITKLSSRHADMMWVAEDYSKADLIKDLEDYRNGRSITAFIGIHWRAILFIALVLIGLSLAVLCG